MKPLLRALVIACALASGSPVSHAQGCSQCRDNLGATPPATQAAYRHAILLLLCTGGSIFIGSALLFKLYRS